jgi:molecular chaperone DnaK (HSP70)
MLSLHYLAVDIGNGGVKASICGVTGRPQVIRTEQGGKSLPSVVFLNNDGKYLVGESAAEHAIVFPSQSESGWKMFLADNTKRYFNGKASAKDFVAVFVMAIIALAEKQLGVKIDGVFVTCPANFNDSEKQGLLDGFALAGVEVIQLLTEPAAAAFAYTDQIRPAPGSVIYIICWDLGHGTFDVSVLEIKDGIAVPIATEGIPQLGGRDFSKLLKDGILKKVSQAAGKTITSDKLTPEQNAEMDEKVEKAKHALSGQISTKSH